MGIHFNLLGLQMSSSLSSVVWDPHLNEWPYRGLCVTVESCTVFLCFLWLPATSCKSEGLLPFLTLLSFHRIMLSHSIAGFYPMCYISVNLWGILETKRVGKGLSRGLGTYLFIMYDSGRMNCVCLQCGKQVPPHGPYHNFWTKF